MSVPKGEAWKKYLNHYKYLLQYDLDSDYPYQELANHFGLERMHIQHMVKWLQEKPEVIAWVRSQYTDESLPNWVGRLEGNVNYVEFLKSKGVDVTMEDNADAVNDTEQGDDVAEVTTVQPHGTGDVTPQTRADIGAQGRTRANNTGEQHGHRQTREDMDGQGKDTANDIENTAHMNDTTKYTGTQEQTLQRKALNVTPVVNKNVKPMPVTIKDAKEKQPEPQIANTPAKQRLVEEMKKIQGHDQNVLPMQGGGYGKIITNEKGQFVGILPMEEKPGVSSTELERAVAEATLEDIQMNTLGLLRRVALNPTVTMGYTYMTTTIDPTSRKYLFVGDLADWINFCVGYTLRYGFGVRFGIFTGGLCMKDVMYQQQSEMNS